MNSEVARKVAPGMRIELRSVEWLVKRTLTTGMKLHLVEAIGLSEIVRDQEMSFILEYETEGTVEIMDPADVTLVPDPSPRYVQTLLYIESLLRTAAPKGANLSIGPRAAIDPMPYQLEPARVALQAPRPRILIADDVGLGKTIEAGILVSELIARGRGKRILVVTTKAMLTQFQKEFWVRFSIGLTRLDSLVLQRIKERLPERHNPFHYFDRTIVSIDTLKNNKRFGAALERADWDIIVIDEAQNVAERRHGSGISQRARLAQTLRNRSDALLLLSATPHDGSYRSFASLMRMLSPLAITDQDNYGPEDIKGLFVRRFRHDEEVQRDLKEVIPERQTRRLPIQATEREERTFEILAGLSLKADLTVRKSSRLFRIVLEKALFSSPAACVETLKRRIQRHRNQFEEESDSIDIAHDIEQLTALQEAVEAINSEAFSRYQLLLSHLRKEGWNGQDSADRLVVFTERIPTLHWLEEHLARDLGLQPAQVTTMSGDMSDVDLNEAKEQFGQGDSKVRLLIASDIAAEGLNLHFQCFRLVHFDLPWSLMTFQQRNGRIDRYGQTRQPLVVYLYTRCRETRIHNDLRIVELLSEKEEQVQRNIGDTGILLGTSDRDEQEEIVAEIIEKSLDSNVVEKDLDAKVQSEPTEAGYSALDYLLRVSASKGSTVGGMLAEEMGQSVENDTIFNSFFDYAAEALRQIDKQRALGLRVHEQDRIIEMDSPAALKDPVLGEPRWMPREALQGGLIKLTDKQDLIQKSVQRALAADGRWPDTQFLWEVHPFADWLGEQMNRLFNRKEVPVAQLQGQLSGEESIFLCFGRIPNQAGSTLLDSWIGVLFRGQEFQRHMEIDEVLKVTELRSNQHVNVGEDQTGDLMQLVEQAVDLAQSRFHAQVENLISAVDGQMLVEAEHLDQLCDRHQVRIELKYAQRKGIQQVIEAERQSELDTVAQWRDEFWDWYERMRRTDEQIHPHCRLVAVLRGS